MSEMIERVAKAICEASSHEWREGTYPIRSGPNFEWEDHDADKLNNHWRHKAIAAVRALREPTPQMLEAGSDEALYARNAWQAMIDAILSDTEERG